MSISGTTQASNIPLNGASAGFAGVQQFDPNSLAVGKYYRDPKDAAKRVSGFKDGMSAYLKRFGLQRLPENFVILGLHGEEVCIKDLAKIMANDPAFTDSLIGALNTAVHNEVYISKALNILNGTINEPLTVDSRENTPKKATRESQNAPQNSDQNAQKPQATATASKPPLNLVYAGTINMNQSLVDLMKPKTSGVATSTNETENGNKIDMSLSAAAFLLGSTRSEKSGTSFINYPEVKGELG